MKIFTLGHSTRTFQEFVDLLTFYGVDLLVDVRKYATSKKFPHFNMNNIHDELKRFRIDYVHIPELGGFRKEGYLVFTKSEQFGDAMAGLLQKIVNRKACIMCSERLFYRCHRRHIAEKLVFLGHDLFHILDQGSVTEHKQDMPEMQLKLFCDKVEKLKP